MPDDTTKTAIQAAVAGRNVSPDLIDRLANAGVSAERVRYVAGNTPAYGAHLEGILDRELLAQRQTLCTSTKPAPADPGTPAVDSVLADKLQAQGTQR